MGRGVDSGGDGSGGGGSGNLAANFSLLNNSSLRWLVGWLVSWYVGWYLLKLILIALICNCCLRFHFIASVFLTNSQCPFSEIWLVETIIACQRDWSCAQVVDLKFCPIFRPPPSLLLDAFSRFHSLCKPWTGHWISGIINFFVIHPNEWSVSISLTAFQIFVLFPDS